MKKTVLITLALLGLSNLVAQTDCTYVPATDSVVITEGNTVTVKEKLVIKYDLLGYPVQRFVYKSNVLVDKDSIYYSGNYRVDSIIRKNVTTGAKATYKKTYSYDANNNLTALSVTNSAGTTESATFTYSSNVLTSITTSSGVTMNSITFNGSGNFASGQIVVSVGGFSLNQAASFSFDANTNIFKKYRALSDEPLSMFTTNNLKEISALNVPAATATYTYTAQNLPYSIIRTEAVSGTGNTATDFYTYDCAASLLVNVNDVTIENSSDAWPNPSVTGIFEIKENASQITVTDMQGKTVLNTSGNKIDLSSEKSGLYFAKISTSNKTQLVKLIIE
ncbi:MAG: T9SS type A sorting domain-containing protein [Cytophagales bacterium]